MPSLDFIYFFFSLLIIYLNFKLIFRHNEGFVWTKETGIKGIHKKNYLPEEEGVWEQSGYTRGDGTFQSVDLQINENIVKIGFMVSKFMFFFFLFYSNFILM